MTHALDEVTRDRQNDNEEIKIRLGCGNVLTLYIDKEGLHIDLEKNVSAIGSQLATTRSNYQNGIMLFVKDTTR